MSEPALEVDRFPLRGKAQDVVLESDGLRHPRSGRGWGTCFTAYDDITHVAVSERFVWIASRRALTVLLRKLFVADGDAERLLRALVGRVAERPGGSERIARMSEIDAWGRDPAPPLITRSVAMICMLLFALQLAFPPVTTVAAFSPVLFADGDWWRLITANLLHSFAMHFLVNLVGLLIVGRLAERALGPVRLMFVMGASAVGCMAASGLLIDGVVVGVSGVLFGLAGSVLFLEVARADELPAWWRFPRVLLWLVWAALVFEVVLGFAVPIIAGEAHLGGMVAGALATALVTRGTSLRAPEPAWVRNGAALMAALTVVAFIAAGESWLGADDFTAEHATRIAGLPGISPDELNNHAWIIAIEPGHTREQLKAALALAERAVAETEGEEATILDTLAEVQFQLGRSEQAVLTIDLAIERAPDESHHRYYTEQRRRFTGERAADDRPEDPSFSIPWSDDSDGPPVMPPPEDGLTV